MYPKSVFWERVMLPTPQVGQLVRLDDYDGRLIVKGVSDDGSSVDLISESDTAHEMRECPVPRVIVGRGLSS
jgi:hypothetical protein